LPKASVKPQHLSSFWLTIPTGVDKNTGFGRQDMSNFFQQKEVIPMDCSTVKKGTECIFMKKKGCTFNGGTCHSIIDECDGCARAVKFESGWFCTTCPDPATKWKNGNCNFATHLKGDTQKGKTKINPLKASKRGGR